jgi:hypothetical protein
MTIIERRANPVFVYSGPERYVRPATRDELLAAQSLMAQQRHVNSRILAERIGRLEGDEWPLTVIELMALASTELGLKMERFAATHGVTRKYAPLPRRTWSSNPILIDSNADHRATQREG